jgi:hypothetical protein
MKNVKHPGQWLLAVALALCAASCGGPDETDAPDPGSTPPGVETQSQELSIIPFNCTLVSSTVILGPGPGHPVPLCQLKLHCFSIDASGNFHVTDRSQISICP